MRQNNLPLPEVTVDSIRSSNTNCQVHSPAETTGCIGGIWLATKFRRCHRGAGGSWPCDGHLQQYNTNCARWNHGRYKVGSIAQDGVQRERWTAQLKFEARVKKMVFFSRISLFGLLAAGAWAAPSKIARRGKLFYPSRFCRCSHH